MSQVGRKPTLVSPDRRQLRNIWSTGRNNCTAAVCGGILTTKLSRRYFGTNLFGDERPSNTPRPSRYLYYTIQNASPLSLSYVLLWLQARKNDGKRNTPQSNYLPCYVNWHIISILHSVQIIPRSINGKRTKSVCLRKSLHVILMDPYYSTPDIVHHDR